MNTRPNADPLSKVSIDSSRSQVISHAETDHPLPASSHDVHVPLIASIEPTRPDRQRIWLSARDRQTAWLDAQRTAKELGRDVQRVDLAAVVSKYLRETEKNLLKIFDTAKESGAVLFFDEAEALFGKRTSVSDAHDRYADLERPYLLQLIENYPGTVILASVESDQVDRLLLQKYAFVEKAALSAQPPKKSLR
jgi:SpoVK/Ycf46/Vps4 family AAA+-type ATPase